MCEKDTIYVFLWIITAACIIYKTDNIALKRTKLDDKIDDRNTRRDKVIPGLVY